ncbi:MAG: 16S rRNA (cytidine(1402)-2'-O)-methyltransferase [Kiritimatiellae bacterium]|nr:16S rRNA (cytidine(1402)-2'-O)-methyltransferase [Kiritimatiellia bacterium]
MEPGLYVVGTPIGNLADLSSRAIETLREVALIVAEDTRITRRLLERYAIRTPMISAHKFSEAARAESVVRRAATEPVALVTDSGMPGLADPGARIVAAARRAGVRLAVVPGPSAATAALALSGYSGDRFVFGGFLPSHGEARRRVLGELLAMRMTLILYESPHRIERLMEDLDNLAPDRRVCLCRELTKVFEETIEGPVPEVRRRLTGRRSRGEFTVVIAPPPRQPAGEVVAPV